MLRPSDFRYGCPIATVALEAASESTPIREACDAVYRDWQAAIGARLQAGGRPPAVAADDAALIMAALEGPLILSRTRRDTQPLHVLRRRLPALLVDAKRPAATL